MPRALIVDDEPLLRDQLRARLAEAWPELDVCTEAANGAEALSLYEANPHDVVFLDIHMPVMNGLDAARMIGRGRADDDGTFHRTHVVFITAYDQHAVTAFDQGAVDYVLKPYEAERLDETVSRLKERLTTTAQPDEPAPADEYADRVSAALAALMGKSRETLKWIKASVGQTVRLIAVDEVQYFQSDEKYTRVVLVDQEVLIRKPIKELVAELDPDRFWQIHRSTIVNSRAIAGVVRGLKDQADLKLKDRPEVLTVSRNFTHLFKQM